MEHIQLIFSSRGIYRLTETVSTLADEAADDAADDATDVLCH